MDVLELPRPVINFLRTMAKESCRYALSWDIFGGPDSVTLTLTWKLIDDESQLSIINEPSSLSSPLKPQQTYDEPHIRPRSAGKSSNPSSSSPRRSRRDNTISTNENASVPAIFRSSRGKSLEDSCTHSNRQTPSHHHQQQHHIKEHQHISSLERPNTIPHHYHQRQKKEQHQQPKQVSTQSDQIYGHLYDARSTPVVKCATVSSLSSSSPSPQSNITPINPPVSPPQTHQQRAKQQQQQPVTPPTVRKPVHSFTNISRTPTIPDTSKTSPSSHYTKLKRTNHIATHDDVDDDEDTLDPWVKRFECSLEDNDDENTERSEDKELLPTASTISNIDDSGTTSGKVKFKTKPDYF